MSCMHLPLSDTVKNGEGQSPKMEYIVAQERSEREARTSVVVKIKIFCVKSKCILYIYTLGGSSCDQQGQDHRPPV